MRVIQSAHPRLRRQGDEDTSVLSLSRGGWIQYTGIVHTLNTHKHYHSFLLLRGFPTGVFVLLMYIAWD